MSNNNANNIGTKNLKYLNIENLFSNGPSKPLTNGKLDIETLFEKKSNKNENKFDSDMLLNGSRKRKIKLEDTYSDIYKSCCDIIKSANDSGITDVFYQVPQHIVECPDYDSFDCMIYIKKKLLDEKISSFILPKSKIKMFITWANLEKKLSQRNENLNKIENLNTGNYFDKCNFTDY